MSIFVGILFILVVVLFGCYFARNLKKKDRISFKGFLDFCNACFLGIGRKNVSQNYEDWESGHKSNSQVEFSYRRKVSYDKYHELENQYQLLVEEKKRLEKQYRDMESKLQSAFEVVKNNLQTVDEERLNLMEQNKRLLCLNAGLKDVAKKLHPVSEDKVSRPFCLYFNNIERLAFAFLNDTTDMLYDVSGNNVSRVIEAVTSFVKEENLLNKSMVKDWLILLSVSSAVTAEAAKDLEHKDDEEAFHYLLKVSFERYFRPLISSLFFLAETVRECLEADRQNRFSLRINDFLEVLRSYDIDVIYCKSGDVLGDVDYDDYEIRTPDFSSVAIAPNCITKVIKYGVNYSGLDCVKDKTIVEMVL